MVSRSSDRNSILKRAEGVILAAPVALNLAGLISVKRSPGLIDPAAGGQINMVLGALFMGKDLAIFASSKNRRRWDDAIRLSGDAAIIGGGVAALAPKFAAVGLAIAAAGWIAQAVGSLIGDGPSKTRGSELRLG